VFQSVVLTTYTVRCHVEVDSSKADFVPDGRAYYVRRVIVKNDHDFHVSRLDDSMRWTGDCPIVAELRAIQHRNYESGRCSGVDDAAVAACHSQSVESQLYWLLQIIKQKEMPAQH